MQFMRRRAQNNDANLAGRLLTLWRPARIYRQHHERQRFHLLRYWIDMLQTLGQVVYDKVSGNDLESVDRREQEERKKPERDTAEKAEFEKENARNQNK